MKNLTIKASTPSYSGSLKESAFVLFAPSLLNDGYSDIINGLTLSGGGGTTENIEVVSSVTKESGETVITGGYSNNTVAFGANTSRSSSPVLTNISDNYENVELNIGNRDVLTKEAADSSGSNIEGVVSTNNVFFAQFLRNPVISTKDIVNDITTETKSVLTSGGSGNLNVVEYEIDGDSVEISGDGYKRFLNDLYSKQQLIKKVRLTIKGTDSNFSNSDVFSLTSKIVNLDADDKKEYDFSLLDYFTPRQVQPNIVDFYPNLPLNQNTALVIAGYFSPDVDYYISIWY